MTTDKATMDKATVDRFTTEELRADIEQTRAALGATAAALAKKTDVKQRFSDGMATWKGRAQRNTKSIAIGAVMVAGLVVLVLVRKARSMHQPSGPMVLMARKPKFGRKAMMRGKGKPMWADWKAMADRCRRRGVR